MNRSTPGSRRKHRITQLTSRIAIGLVALFALAACAADDGPVTVTIGYNSFLQNSFGPGPAPIEAIQAAVAERYPDISVELNVMPDSTEGMRSAIAVWMTSQDGNVDIYGMDTPWVLEFGSAGWAVPLQDEIPSLTDNFVEAGLDVFSHDGDVLGVPFWGSVSGLYYREDLLDEFNLDVPTTYDELLEAIDTIRAEYPELTGFTWPGSRAERLTMIFADFMFGFGGQYRNDAGELVMGGRAGEEALAFMRELIEQGYSPAELTSWNPEEARRRFVEGRAIFHWGNADLIVWLDDPERSAVADRWGFGPTPRRPGGSYAAITGGFAFSANPHSDSPEATLQVLEVIASEEIQRAFAIAWGPVQYYEGLYDDPAVQDANPNSELISSVLPYAVNRPPSEDYAQLSAVIQDEVHAALTEVKNVDTAFSDLLSRIGALD